MHYTDEQLCQLLEQVDSDDHADGDFVHLESCEACRNRLSHLAGEGAWLHDWMDSVGDVTSDSNLREGKDFVGSRSVVVSVEASDRMVDRLQCDSVRLDFLEAPAHPELLGRLGRYDIERLIGMGGYGIVFKARDSELNRVVAIKVLAPHLMNSGPARQRFAREAQASAAVVHDHVVPIYDVVNDNDLCYFVMQYIAGKSLQERVDRQGPLPTEEVLQIGAQVAAGLQAAHEQGLIHRDVKPGNVLLEENVNRVMISDFGLARASDDASLTRSGTITGTPHYMSPEQARGQAIDARSDLFSLGSVIYFMCTGRSPFRAPQMMAVLNRICHESYRPIEESNPSVPYELTKLVDSMLSKKVEERPASADEVHRDLTRLLNDFHSGKLRPRRFVPTPAMRAYAKPTGWAALAMIVITVVALRWPKQHDPTDWSAAPTPAPSPSRIASQLTGLGTTRLQAAMDSTDRAVNSLEQRLAAFPSSGSTDAWSIEVNGLDRELERIELELDSEDRLLFGEKSPPSQDMSSADASSGGEASAYAISISEEKTVERACEDCSEGKSCDDGECEEEETTSNVTADEP